MMIAILLGCVLGFHYQEFPAWVDSSNIGEENILLNFLFIVILFTPFARVDYSKIKKLRGHIKSTSIFMLLNWIIGPTLFFFFTYYLFKDQAHYIVGLVLVCNARSKSDLLYLTKTFSNDMDYTDGVVALNTLVQVLLYTIITWVFICFLPIQLDGKALMNINYVKISEKAAIYIGFPFILGLFSRLILTQLISVEWYNKRFTKISAKISFFAVLVLCFCITTLKVQTMKWFFMCLYTIFIPLTIYFILQYALSFTFKIVAKKKKGDVSSLLLTGIIHNFRIALIISITLFGINSLVTEVVLAATLIEFLVILSLSKITEHFFYKNQNTSSLSFKFLQKK